MDILEILEDKNRAEKKNKVSLTKLERNFYRKISEEISRLESEKKILFEKGDVDSLYQKMEEIKRVKKALRDLINIRLRKIILAAFWENKRLKNMTVEEEAIYAEIRNIIDNFIREVFEVKKEEKAAEKKEREERYILVRVLSPSFRIALPDRNLELKKEDVLHVPEKVYEILSKNGIVEKIKS